MTASLYRRRTAPLHNNDYQAIQYLLITLQIGFIRKIFPVISR